MWHSALCNTSLHVISVFRRLSFEQRFLVTAVVWAGAHLLGWFMSVMGAHCFGSCLNHCGHVVVFYSNPGHSLHSVLEQVHMKMMWSAGVLLLLSSSQSLLEAFVMQSALFVQLEISPGLPQHPTSPHPGVNGWRPFSTIPWIVPCSQWELWALEAQLKPFIWSAMESYLLL